jgi:hypothetical protein
MCETVGRLWTARMRDVRADGSVWGLRARRRSGLSRTTRVLRWIAGVPVGGEVEREDMASVTVVLRCARSSDFSE